MKIAVFYFSPLSKVRLFILILASLLSIESKGQRLNTGLTYDVFGIHPTSFGSDMIFSETNYRAYYIDKVQYPSALTMNIAFNLVVDYSRYFTGLRFGISSVPNGIKYQMKYPVGTNEFLTYYSRITYQQTDLSVNAGYYLSARKFFKPFIEIGVGRCSPYFYDEDFSTDKSFATLWDNRHEIKEYLNLDKSYTYLLVGYGYKGDIMAVSARYRIRLGDHDVFYSSLSLGISVYSKFSKLRKHYIYQPEE